MLKTIYIVRHGETDWNKQKKLMGYVNVPLNEEGRKQAEKTAIWFKDKKIDSIYSSDLIRAFETAAIIAQYHNLPVVKTLYLRGRNFGQFAGMTKEEIKKTTPDLYENLMDESNLHWNANGVEPIISVKERIRTFFNKIKPTDEAILVVAHGSVIRQMLRFFSLIKETERPETINASITIIHQIENGVFEYESLNDSNSRT
jgi:broad specificity phosphatase PhoE